MCTRYIYCVHKVFTEYMYYPENIVCRNDDTRGDWCQPDCIPNVHLMQIHKYKYANTQIQIRKYTNTPTLWAKLCRKYASYTTLHCNQFTNTNANTQIHKCTLFIGQVMSQVQLHTALETIQHVQCIVEA